MSYTVAIGGVRGTGKSSIARQLAALLQADVISSGRVREIIRAQHDKAQTPILFRSVSGANSLADSVQVLHDQAETMRASFDAAVVQPLPRKARYILEGVHFYPGYFDERDHLDIHIILTAPNTVLRDRLERDSKDSGLSVNIERVLEIQDHFREEAVRRAIQTIDSTSLTWAVIHLIRLLSFKDTPMACFGPASLTSLDPP